MGCSTSKVDDLPAVDLCRRRLAFLDEAIRLRYDLSDAHLAYLRSLKSVCDSLQRFVNHAPDGSDFPRSPIPDLPPVRKEGDVASASAVRHSDSNSAGSHLHFDSGSEDDASSGCLHHSGHSSPLHDHLEHIDFEDEETSNSDAGEHFSGGGGGGGGISMHFNYMKNRAVPSVSYEQRPMNPETGRMAASFYHDSPSYTNNSGIPMRDDLFSYDGHPNYGSTMNGDFGMQSSYGSFPAAANTGPTSSSSSSRPAPPPPPPSGTTWNFLNLFDGVQNFGSNSPLPYTHVPDSNKSSDEEGIPELEYDDYPHEVVKEVDRAQKPVAGGGARTSPDSVDGDDDWKKGREALYQARPRASIEEEESDYELHSVNDEAPVHDEMPKEAADMGAAMVHGGSRGVREVLKQILLLFERASESGNEVTGLLEAGKLPYRHKTATHVSTKIFHAIPPSLSVVSSRRFASQNAKSSTLASAAPDFNAEIQKRSQNISTTLQKCYHLEKKLYDEVKAEEKLRMKHEKTCSKLKDLDETGAENSKIDSTRALIRTLSTKVQTAIQYVDKISVMISKLRDEELWPQINQLIQGLTRMWRSMRECHHHQIQAVKEAKNLDAIALHKKPTDSNLQATMELTEQLIDWTLWFSGWMLAQKGFVKALNNWLLKCLLYEPENTPDGIVPFSPSRIGAPPLFVICNQWSQALEMVSEKEVAGSIRDLALSVHQLWKDMLERHQGMVGKKGMERKDMKLQKGIRALNKIEYRGGNSNGVGLQAGLLHIFEAMDVLAANSDKVYEELLQRIEGDR